MSAYVCSVALDGLLPPVFQVQPCSIDWAFQLVEKPLHVLLAAFLLPILSHCPTTFYVQKKWLWFAFSLHLASRCFWIGKNKAVRSLALRRSALQPEKSAFCGKSWNVWSTSDRYGAWTWFISWTETRSFMPAAVGAAELFLHAPPLLTTSHRLTASRSASPSPWCDKTRPISIHLRRVGHSPF